MLLVELDGNSQGQVEAESNAIVDLCLEAGALDVYVGNTPATEKRMWNPRRSWPRHLSHLPVQSLEDIVVPLAQIPHLMPELERLSRQYNVLIPCYGHAADGNLHATIVKQSETLLEEWQVKLPQVLGTCTGWWCNSVEPSVGARHWLQARALLAAGDDPALIALQQRIKQAFDR